MARSRCPICNGPENNNYFSHIETKGNTEYAVFIVECWSGNTQGKQAYHIYKKRVKLSHGVELDQLIELEKEFSEYRTTSKKYVADLEKEVSEADAENDKLKESIEGLRKELVEKGIKNESLQKSIDHLKTLVNKQTA